ncbi:amino acid abc transporter permease protein 3-tm domain [Trichococcus palustris]|uniref:Amino acid abc transporter permease protein 3-tm domain n=1 Tax=Trichococcus palustris TaxID=140314 RepID=A0A143YVN9_9LACT|nr:amino acid ABC transporter permease [Trichococcus palustris]CZQ97890.1 amino acid abc transporter permease protein 3-tm domain [Trichococcus palustris]SFL15019.1 amino acid ABC transporter membrane protein 1, PAAT family [Trichococcus palustris]
MFTILVEYFDTFSLAFRTTLIASLVAMLLSLIFGTLLAVFQVSKNKALNKIGNLYVECFKNIPLLVITMFFYIAIPLVLGVKMNGMAAGTIGLTIYSTAFIADVVRTGIQAVPAGQMEAGLATGLNYWETMVNIVLPQAFKIVIPPLGNQFITLVKNSSVLGFVAGADLMYAGDLVSSETFNMMGTYLVISLFYLVITLPLNYVMAYVERKMEVA